jgi:hypothetical protein
MIKKLLCITAIVALVAFAGASVSAATWSATGAASGSGTYIRSGSPGTVTGQPTTIQAGYSSSGTILIRRGLLQWNMNSAPGQAAVNSASNSVRVGLTQTTGTSQSAVASIVVSNVNADWNTGNASWNTLGGNVGTAFASQTCTANGAYVWSWNGSTAGIPGANRGIFVTNGTSEASSSPFKAFAPTGTLDIDFTLCNAAAAAAATASTSSIAWNWGDASANETGFRLYNNAATGAAGTGLVGSGVAANATTQTEGGLTANTSYTRYIRTYTALVAGTDTGQETAGTALSAVTLSVAPISSSVASATSNQIDFTWTSALAWGAGGVSSLGYVFDQNATHTFTGGESAWTSGTLGTTANVSGDWYLHVQGYNSVGASNGTYNYLVTATVPEPSSMLAFATGFIGLFGIIRRKRA